MQNNQNCVGSVQPESIRLELGYNRHLKRIKGVIPIAHNVIWTKMILEEFIKEGNLTEFEEGIMRTRVAGMTRVQQSFKFNVSLSTIDRAIRILKRKYDEVQKTSLILPPRKFSMEELYQDLN